MVRDHERVLSEAARMAVGWLDSLGKRAVGAAAPIADLRESLGGPLPAGGQDPADVLRRLVADVEPGTVAMAGPRYFGFVIGGSHPIAVGADWLTAAWDQNAGLVVGGPAAAVAEEVAGAWLAELLGLPASASFAFVTGCQMAHFTALAAARSHVLARAGWDVERDGLFGAPPVTVIVGEERHVTVDRALRYLGFGHASIRAVPADGQGRMRADLLGGVLADAEGPVIVCVQAGNVNTGAFDDIAAVCDAVAGTGAWVHVDGAFGLWAAASPTRRRLVAGAERADSWATDGHKWLNVPYDSGFAYVRHRDAHRTAMAVHAAYLEQGDGEVRDQMDWNPEFSRRARAYPVYAVLRALGRDGVADLVDRCCDHAARFADRLGGRDGVKILNDVALNQVLVRFGDDDDLTRAVIDGVQRDGTCWLSGTVWQGRAAMRISVSNWSTTTGDVDLSVEAIDRVFTALR